MRKNIKRVSLTLLAGALACAMPLMAVSDVAAERFNPSEDFVDASGVPDGKELVTMVGKYPDSVRTYDDGFLYTTGIEGVYTKLMEIFNELDGAGIERDSEEGIKRQIEFFDDIGYFWTDIELIDFHLIDTSTGGKVEYEGDGITITFNVGWYDLAERDDEKTEIYSYLAKYSTKTWEKGFMHIRDDGTREWLPATEDEDGNWIFTAKDFSMFVPGLRAVEEEPSPNTLDNTLVYTGVAGIGAISLFVLGAWFVVKERK